MNHLEQAVELVWVTPNAEEVIEKAARVCYKSEDKIDNEKEYQDRSSTKMIQHLVSRGHFSVIEHASACFKLTTDRGISHELVRHRMASFSQESSRYCSYDKGKFGGQIALIKPDFKNQESYAIYEEAMKAAENAYMKLSELGESPQFARSVLPTCLKTELYMTCNFREWLHVIELRTSKAAHPQVRELISMVEKKLIAICPAVFG